MELCWWLMGATGFRRTGRCEPRAPQAHQEGSQGRQPLDHEKETDQP
jgi:hypothetical protein